MEQALFNIQLTVKHVRGESNPIVDALSRVHMSKCVYCKRDLVSKGCTEVVNDSMFLLPIEQCM